MNFDALLDDMREDSKHIVAPSTGAVYERLLEYYEFIISQIPNADPPFPPTVKTIGAFFAYRKRHGCCYSTIRFSLFALKFHILANGWEDVTSDESIKTYIKSLQRVMHSGYAPYAANSIHLGDLESICDNTGMNNFTDCRDTAMMCMQFHLMLRVAEISALRLEDISVAGDIYKFRIVKSKTDQTAKGRDIFKRISSKKTNPIRWIMIYIKFLSQTTEGPLFVGSSMRGIPLNTCLTASAIAKRYKKKFTEANLEPSDFTSHSLRKGGARHAALSGASVSSIQATGGWRSSCFLKYTAVEPEEAFIDIDKHFD